MINMQDVTIGCDPELFVRKTTGRCEFVSAHGLIPGTKEKPHPVAGGAIQVDGMAVEFNTDPTNRGATHFFELTQLVLAQLKQVLGDDYEVVSKPWTRFSQKVWDKVPPEAMVLGCDPDFNAYTMAANNPPNGKVDFRTAAGHLHIGWTKGMDVKDPGHLTACSMLTKELDACIGLASVLLDTHGGKRRELYGKAGCFRPKPYGVEYRTPSNFWVGDEELTRWMYDTAISCVEALLKGVGVVQKYGEMHTNSVRDAIDSSDKRIVSERIQQNGTQAGVITRRILRHKGVF